MSEYICTADYCPYRDPLIYYCNSPVEYCHFSPEEHCQFRKKSLGYDFYKTLIEKPQKMTNADRIRSMSDKELAEFLEIETDTYYRYGNSWLGWLKETEWR